MKSALTDTNIQFSHIDRSCVKFYSEGTEKGQKQQVITNNTIPLKSSCIPFKFQLSWKPTQPNLINCENCIFQSQMLYVNCIIQGTSGGKPHKQKMSTQASFGNLTTVETSLNTRGHSIC